MSKIKEYLKSIGTPTATITALEKAEADDKSELDVSPLVDEYKATQRKLLENDPDLVSEIEGKAKGKLLDIYTRKMKAEFTLDAALIKDKTFEEVIKIAKTESSKNVDKDLKTVQEENTTLNAKLKEYEDVTIPKIKSEVENEKKAFKINTSLQKKIPSADLRVPSETVDLVLNSQIAALYDLDLDDKGEIMIYGKGTRLQAQTSDKSKILTLDDVITDILKKNKFVKESNADDIDPNTGKKKTIQPTDEEKKRLDAMTPAQKKSLEHQKVLEKEAAEKATAKV